ncbi:MAG: 30S ribosomal protein S4 [Candidatus Coatesbacteria bacterium]|nr:30S ribosomal protein S4 [Candidatus Coatesbacteria bacterium]
MARYTGPKCKLCRREGVKLYLKGQRCNSNKCAMERRPDPPGMHGRRRRRRSSSYGLQLREKQRIRRTYGLLEAQFFNFYKKAEQSKGITGHNLLIMLETRLDNVLFRSGFVATRQQARQLIRHGHVSVDGRKVDIPSQIIDPEETVRVREKSGMVPQIKFRLEKLQPQAVNWLEVDNKKLEIKVARRPQRDDIALPFNEQLVVELYSR